MESIEMQLIEQVESMDKKFADDEKIKEFEKTLIQFDELVKRGVAQKRGYNLLSPTDSHIKSQVWFNLK